MKVLFVADARSPIARGWISHFARSPRYDVLVLSTHTADSAGLPVRNLPLAFNSLSKLKGEPEGVVPNEPVRQSRKRSVWRQLADAKLSKPLMNLRRDLTGFEAWLRPRAYRRAIESFRPDLVHALRIPFEGIVAASALRTMKVPLIVSVWGNDFTLYGQQAVLGSQLVQRVLGRADALMADCYRDIRLAHELGLSTSKPTAVFPGGGGIDRSLFKPANRAEAKKSFGFDPNRLLILNPRGFRDYVRNDLFFESLPLVIREHPQVTFACLDMFQHPVAEEEISRRRLEEHVRLLPKMSHPDVARLFQAADIVVSPSIHDGTPNTLLEALACGSFPVVGDIESVREWISDGSNGFVVELQNAERLANAVVRSITDADLRKRAAVANSEIVDRRATYGNVMQNVELFYSQVVTQLGGR